MATNTNSNETWRVFLLCLLGVLFYSAGTVEGAGCEQQGVCACVFENGSRIDLGELGRKDGTPLIKDFRTDEPFSYSFNPCYPFNEESCINVAGCQLSIPDNLSYPIGDSSSANLTYANGILTGVYASMGTLGMIRTSIVSYICDYDAETPQASVFGEDPLTTYKFSIKSKYACVTSPATPTQTPIPTPISTSTAKKGCHTNYGNFIKRCEVEYDGHEEPVKVLFIQDWNGSCKFPTNKDVAINLYSQSSTCAGVTNRCNPAQAFSVNGEVCKEIN